MIDVKVYNVTFLATNCCYLVDKATGKSAVVDPGDKSDELIEQIMQKPITEMQELYNNREIEK